ncbi:hypothetical protein JCM17961_48550 [Endothiovibrio diazotrophicus]
MTFACNPLPRLMSGLALLLLALVNAGIASVASAAPFSITAIGNSTPLSARIIDAHLQPASEDLGQPGTIWIGADIPGVGWYFRSESGWMRYVNGSRPSFRDGTLVEQDVEDILGGVLDLTGYVGSEVYVGYGLDEQDMLAGRKYSVVETVAIGSIPTVTAAWPQDGAVGQPLNSAGTAAFSEPMDPATISAATFTVTRGNTPVAGTVSYSGTTATFRPTGNFAPATRYTATLTTGARNFSGNALAADYVWSWTTREAPDESPPTIGETIPESNATDVAPNGQVTVVFDEAMDAATINPTAFSLADGNGDPVSGSVELAASGTTAVFTPAADLAYGSRYTATITSGVLDLAGNALVNSLVWSFTTSAAPAAGPAPVILGTAGGYAILAKAGISTVPTSAVTGNIGVSPIDSTAVTGFSLILDATTRYSTSPQVFGEVYAADYTPPTPTRLTTAVSDMESAYTDAAGRAADVTELGTGNIGGMTLTPAVYKWGTALLIPSELTLSGGPNDVWIFQIARDLIVENGAVVTLSGGARSENIFWQVAGETALGTTSNFSGVILCQTLISLNTGAILNGRALAQTAVTLNAGTVTAP